MTTHIEDRFREIAPLNIIGELNAVMRRQLVQIAGYRSLILLTAEEATKLRDWLDQTLGPPAAQPSGQTLVPRAAQPSGQTLGHSPGAPTRLEEREALAREVVVHLPVLDGWCARDYAFHAFEIAEAFLHRRDEVCKGASKAPSE